MVISLRFEIESGRYRHQIGPRYLRRRMAAVRNAAVTARPSHRPGLRKKWNGAKSIIGSIRLACSMIAVPSEPPVKRLPIKEPRYVVLKATFSTIPMASGGNVAQRIGTRRAQTEINRS